MNPKYYRCLISGIPDQFTKDKIYKIINPDNIEAYGNFTDNRGKPNGCSPYNYKYFEPVTELEWNLQEGIITPVNKEDYSYLIKLLKKSNII